MENKKTITYFLYLDRSGAMKIRKQKYAVADGELSIKLTLNIPQAFFKPLQIYKEINTTFKELPDLNPEISSEIV